MHVHSALECHHGRVFLPPLVPDHVAVTRTAKRHVHCHSQELVGGTRFGAIRARFAIVRRAKAHAIRDSDALNGTLSFMLTGTCSGPIADIHSHSQWHFSGESVACHGAPHTASRVLTRRENICPLQPISLPQLAICVSANCHQTTY